MRSVEQSATGRNFYSSCISLLIIVGGFFASFAALAVNEVILDAGCVQDQPFYNAGLNCTANDTTLSSPTIAVVKECNFPGDTAILNVTVDITVGAQTRYDLGVWIAIDGDPNGDGAATGECAVLSVPNDLIEVDQLTSTFGDGDYCGDVFNVDPDGIIVPPTETAHLLGADLGTFPVPCNDSDGDGKLDVPIIVAWKQQANNDCPATNYVVPGTASKCVQDLSFALDVPIPGQIIVDKVTVPADDTVFNFLLEGPPSGIVGGFDGSEIFSLSDASTPFDTAVFAGGLPAGVYSVSEEVAPGYVLSASCTGSAGAEDPAAIDVSPGETVNCTFTNTLDSATINVVKNTVGGNGQFAINWFGPTTSGGVFLDTGVINTDSDVIVTTETGTFSLTELIPPGWELIQGGCVDDNGGAVVAVWDGVDTIPDINLLPGDSVTCTFTNAALGTVTLIKNTTGGDGSFDFVTDVPNLGTNIQTSSGTGQTSASNVPAGVYSIVEIVPPGWALDSATCSDGSPPEALDVSDGETVTCTFNNIKLGTLILEKQTLPDGDPASFDFTGDVVATLSDGQNLTLQNNVIPGAYTTTETPLEGWELTDITCDDGNSSGDIVSGTTTFNVEAGETVKCTYTNTKDGSIEVVKSLAATGPDSELFSFTSSFNGDFDLEGDAATTGPIPVTPGSGYTVSENDPTASGWAVIGAICTGGDVPSTNITVSPGEAVVCTFTNTPLGSATIIKNTIGGDGTFDFTGDAPFNGLQLTTLEGTASQDFTYVLDEGFYVVTEEPVPAGWALTGLNCEETGVEDTTWQIPTATMGVQFAETVTCTFTNTADGTLIIRKETIPDASAQGFDFTGSASGTLHDYSDTAEELTVSGQPGIYTSAETVPDGWAITNISCTGQDQGITIGENDVSVDLEAGATVICTFENTALGSVTIEKLTQGDVGAFNFNGDFGAFQLDTTGANPVSSKFSDLLPGTYMVSEVIPTNWTLSNIICTPDTNSTITIGGANGFEPGDQGVTIDLLDGEEITCTFVNDAHGSITVAKATDPTGSLQEFDFTGDITATLTDGQLSSTVPVPAGQYTVTESAVPGWDVTDITCTDGDSSGAGNTATFNVNSGEHVVCYFTNTIQRGQIVVDKVTDPSGSAQSFDFTLTGTDVDLAFALTDAAVPYNSGDLLPTSENGTYNVAEAAVAGWVGVGVCSDGSPVGAVDVSPGEVVTCTFTNTIQNSGIIIDKVTVPAGSAQLFDFTLTGTDVNQAFQLADATAPYNSGDLLPTSENGTYNVAEAAVAGWVGESVCSDGSPVGAVDLSPGEVVTCTFTNTIQPGAIIVDKVTVPAGSAQLFDFTLTGTGVNQAFQLADATAPYNSGDLLPSSENGTYNVAEAAVAGWVGESVCSDGSPVGAVDVAPGETVTCTFTNTQTPVINLVKTATGPVLEADSTYTVIYTITATNTGGPGVYDLTDTFSPAAGITLNTAELTSYSSANDSQTGAIIGGSIPAAFVSGNTIVTGEPLAPGNDETWTITANFTVVPGDVTGDATACVQGAEVAGTGFYNYVDGNIEEDTTDNDACVNLLVPAINLAKSSTAPVSVGGNLWEVVYTISATNTGQGPGLYDIIDTMMPGTGITPVIDANYPAISYAGGEVPSGDLTTPPLANGGTWVTGEALAALSAESWTVTARFTVDIQALVSSPGSEDCILETDEQGTGYFNYVEGSATDIDLSDNETCVEHLLPMVPVPTLNKLALLLLTLMLLATGWYFRPAAMRRF